MMGRVIKRSNTKFGSPWTVESNKFPKWENEQHKGKPKNKNKTKKGQRISWMMISLLRRPKSLTHSTIIFLIIRLFRRSSFQSENEIPGNTQWAIHEKFRFIWCYVQGHVIETRSKTESHATIWRCLKSNYIVTECHLRVFGPNLS